MMTDALLRREIKRLVEQQKALNQRLQRRPPPASKAGGGPPQEEGAPVTIASAETAASSTGASAAAPPAPGLNRRPQGSNVLPVDYSSAEFQISKRPKIEEDPSAAKRNKRIFGFLSTHLNKAKQQLAKEKDTDFAQRHKLQEERVKSKLELARRHIAEIALLQWTEQRREDESQLAKVANELVQKENELMRYHLVQHYGNMEHFVGTEAQPTLFWRPAEWDDHTKRLQQQTKLWIQTKIKHIQDADYAYKVIAASGNIGEEEEEGEVIGDDDGSQSGRGLETEELFRHGHSSISAAASVIDGGDERCSAKGGGNAEDCI